MFAKLTCNVFGEKTECFNMFVELKRIVEAEIFDEILVTSETKTNSECRFGLPKKEVKEGGG